MARLDLEGHGLVISSRPDDFSRVNLWAKLNTVEQAATLRRKLGSLNLKAALFLACVRRTAIVKLDRILCQAEPNWGAKITKLSSSSNKIERAWKLERYAAAAVLSFVGAISLLLLRNSSPNGSDFIAFWSAGRMVWEGRASDAYDLAVLKALQSRWRVDLPFMNPPPLLLLVAPFAMGSYHFGFLAWLIGTLVVYFAVVRRMFPNGPWLATVFPPVMVCIVSGQNGLVTGALFLGAMMLLGPRPFLAGMLIGALVIKPQLALLVPVALLAAGYWRAIAGAAVTALGLLALTEAVLPGTFAAFLAGAQQNLGDPSAEWIRMRHSVHSALTALGAPAGVALSVQLTAALIAAVVVWRTWRRQEPVLYKAAVLAAATPLATPYIFDYDLALLVLPMALVARERPWLALALSVVPIFSRWLSIETGLQVAPVMYAVLLWAVLTLEERKTEVEPVAITAGAG